MKKIYKIEIDCPNCALKAETKISKLDGINECQINFMTQKMLIDAENPDSLKDLILKTGKKVDSDFNILD